MHNITNLTYLTYQVFPNQKANNLQTIRMLENFSKNQIKVKLFFPNRGNKDTTIDDIYKFYDIKENFEIYQLAHKLPFNYFKYLDKFNFLISNFIWSYYSVKNIMNKVDINEVIMTRTPWVLYFLSKYKNLLIFECHKFSKINNFIFKRLKDKENIILIFTNNNLKNDFTISKKLEKKSIILESSYEESLFSNFRKNKIKRKIVFVGNLLRFDKKRDIDFLIEVFNDEKLKDFNLVIIGGPNDVAEELQKISGENIKFLGFMSNKNAIKEMETAEIGILINEKNRHSEKHTSPIKYFEYLRSGLKILAVNFDSHVKLPINENVLYFEKGHKEDFMKNLFKLDHAEFKNNNEIIKYSYNYRVQRLLKHIARLEGLEPPTL